MEHCNAKSVFSQQTTQFQNYLGVLLKFYIVSKLFSFLNTTICCLSRNKGYYMSVCTDVLNKSSKLDLTQTEMWMVHIQEYKCIRVSLRNQYLTGSQLAASLKSTCQATVSSGMKPFVLSFKKKPHLELVNKKKRFKGAK